MENTNSFFFTVMIVSLFRTNAVVLKKASEFILEKTNLELDEEAQDLIDTLQSGAEANEKQAEQLHKILKEIMQDAAKENNEEEK